MTDVPNQAIFRCVKGVVKSDREFDCSQGRAGMATNPGHGFQDVAWDLIGDCTKLIWPQGTQIRRRVNTFEKGHCGLIVTLRIMFYYLTNFSSKTCKFVQGYVTPGYLAT